MIEIDSLEFRYPKSENGLKALSLNIADSGIAALLGKNGAGKTTLIHLICGLLFPQSGSVRVKGKESRSRLPETLSEIFLVPEEFGLPELTSAEFAKNFGAFYPRFETSLFEKCLDELEVPSRQKIHKMSFGQKKKIFLAFALAARTRILILDEPTNGLDIEAKVILRRILAETQTPERICIISTHQVLDIQNLPTQLLVIDRGKLLCHESMEKIEQTFQIYPEGSEYSDEVFFQNQNPGGSFFLGKNLSDQPAKIDLESFFLAMIQETQKMQKAL